MKTSTKLLIGLAVLTLATPLGMLAKGTAWGEWTSKELEQRLGFIPEGLRHLESLWTARLAGYSVSDVHSGLSYLGSAVLGVSLILLLAWAVGRFLVKKGPHDS